MSDEEKAAGVSSAVNHYSSDLEAYLSTGSDVRSDESSTFSTQHPRGNVLQRFADSFRPINLEDDGIDTLCMTPLEISIYATARHPLARSLKLRHLQMIAIGGSIGTGLFIGSGYALSQGGPASVLIGYTLVGFSMFCVVMALGELLVQFPVLGLFNAFFLRFLEPTWGWLLGLLYAMSWLISLPSELVACLMTIQYWHPDVNPAVWVAVFYVVIFLINLFGVKGYGEVEFVLSIIKVLAVIGFIILLICIICGVGRQGYIGGKYWHKPGAFHLGFKGVCLVFILAAFSFGGCELVALAALETQNPRKLLPRATKQVFWRITIFYILTAIVIGFLVPYNDVRLLDGDSLEDITLSPFVIAIFDAGIKALPLIMNAVILVAVVSVGNSSVYGCLRTLASLAVQQLIPIGVIGLLVGAVILVLIVIGEIWVSIWPIGEKANVTQFFQNCLSLPLAIVMYVGHKTYHRSWGLLYVKLTDIDLDSGRREIDVEALRQQIADEKADLRQKPFYVRFYRFWC